MYEIVLPRVFNFLEQFRNIGLLLILATELPSSSYVASEYDSDSGSPMAKVRPKPGPVGLSEGQTDSTGRRSSHCIFYYVTGNRFILG
jgi:hypothetical protein